MMTELRNKSKKAFDATSARLFVLFCLVGFLIIPVNQATATMDAAKRDEVARSVVQVRGLGCSGGDRSGSGFTYNSSEHVVTAFHVVAGCSRLAVFYEKHGGLVLDATIERVSSSTDLALLSVPGSPAAPLQPAQGQVQVNEDLEAIGYYLGVPSMDNKPLRVTFGSTRLSSMLSDNLRKELQQKTSIDLQIDVVRLDGHLLPGLSGAPVLNRNGEVVGIGSGGLQNGAASVSFAIPSNLISGLLSSDEALDNTAYSSGLLFSAPLDLDNSQTRYVCGNSEFVLMGQRSTFELSLTTDDPAGLNQLLQRMNMPANLVNNFLFNIFVATDTGATVAIPHWMDVSLFNGNCLATASAPHLSHLGIEFSGHAQVNINQASISFEQDFIDRTSNTWQPDLSLSYMMPTQRFDGLTVNRKTVSRPVTAQTQEIAFETLMGKGTGFAGVIAHSTWWNAQHVGYCYNVNFTDPACNDTGNALPPIFQMIIAVHLSTFPLS